VARLGEDQFMVVSEVSQEQQLMTLGERLRSVVQQPYAAADQLFSLSVSVGMAMTDVEASDPIESVRNAEAALARAKGRGRGELEMFDPAGDFECESEAALEIALRQALANGEFELYVQPIVDARSGRPWGAEALLRWQRPGHGLVLPGLFIPTAEKSKLINEIERWVLSDVCRLLSQWTAHEATRHLHLAVNVSGRHLLDRDFIPELDRAIASHRVERSLLEMELTETHLLSDVERAALVLDKVRERGIEVAVDDFGTGYASMQYLRHLPLTTLKIDRTFVSRIAEMGHDRTIIEALLQLGRAMDLEVVAEGVETPEQLAFLAEAGCHRVQGFHLARPMPAPDFMNWLTVHGRDWPSGRQSGFDGRGSTLEALN
jgi:EAL domain-containing protein (putative c-di-GMP-specific phosphodiesterase class I)